jgi:hypothetical protein
MAIIDYTTYDDIRAVLGVSEDDLEDETLALELYDNYLTMDLEEVNIDLPTTYDTVSIVATPTEAQARFLQATRLFATYSVAKQLSTSLPLFAAKQVTDSKAEMTRFDNPYKDVVSAIAKDYERLRNRLIQTLNSLGNETATATRRSLMSVVSPGFDPITGA